MATIRKRNNTYLITVSCGYDITGKQIRRTMTYKPEQGMNQRQIEKEVQRQAVLFEEDCQKGLVMSGNIRFELYAKKWFEYKRTEVRARTYASYQSLLPRINAALGHMRLDRIQPQHLISFYNNLSEGGIRENQRYICKVDLDEYIRAHNLKLSVFAKQCGISESSLFAVRKGRNVGYKTAESISKVLLMPLSDLFNPLDNKRALNSNTVLHYHKLLSTMFKTAVLWGMISGNPCERVKPPRVGAKEPKYLDEKQSAIMLDLLEYEREDYRVMIRTLLFTGMRRGELLGLKWADFDFKKGLLQISRSVQYLPERGVYVDETKTETSKRIMKLPKMVVADLKQHRIAQLEQRLKCGDRWIDNDFVFTNAEGRPFRPDTLSNWFREFIAQHNDVLPEITVHSLRHTNATLMIAEGIPITTVSKRLGHSNSVTTGRVYAHSIQSVDEAAAEKLENLFAEKQENAS